MDNQQASTPVAQASACVILTLVFGSGERAEFKPDRLKPVLLLELLVDFDLVA
jgi:hypothetical protein